MENQPFEPTLLIDFRTFYSTVCQKIKIMATALYRWSSCLLWNVMFVPNTHLAMRYLRTWTHGTYGSIYLDNHAADRSVCSNGYAMFVCQLSVGEVHLDSQGSNWNTPVLVFQLCNESIRYIYKINYPKEPFWRFLPDANRKFSTINLQF